MTPPMSFSVAVDASRNRSGGAIGHLLGILGAAEPERYGIHQVHVWSYEKLLRTLPDRPWLVRHNPAELERGIFAQLSWQRWQFPKEIRRAGCGIVFNSDAGSVGRFRPSVTLSQDILSYEPGEIERYGWTRMRLRLWLLRHMQNRSLRHADAAMFLTQHHADMIQRSCGPLASVAVVPHGVDDDFRGVSAVPWPAPGEREIRCLYVSNAAHYKHQWHVVRAVERLRKAGRPLTLTLVGGGNGPAQARLEEQIRHSDPDGAYVKQMPFLPHHDLPGMLRTADLFIFASSCEAFGITLLEGMAAGLPIACSNRSSMPELLRDGGSYFDPEDDASIARAIQAIIDDAEFRDRLARRASTYADAYTWKRCAESVFETISRVYRAPGR